jgi:hypothetical protein
MISIDQYRARIGNWYLLISCKPTLPKTGGKCSATSHNNNLLLLIILLLLAGDVHPNPGPVDRGRPLNISHINARSIRTYDQVTRSYLKFEEVESHLIHTMKSDILCISETWLDRTVTDCELDIPNYTLFRNDRNRRGGGVAIYVSDVLTTSRRPDLEHQDVESVWLEIINNKKKILL